MEIIEINSPKYPERLKKIENPPKVLYALGDISLLNKNCLAIVGTRMATIYGKEMSKYFAKELAKKDICIVSGFAEGIDTFAHIGAKEEIGKTIAVMGCGLNRIYPMQNYKLFFDIIEKGCVISEYEPDEEMKAENFPHRNRIISGLSMGVLVVEGRFRSGTSITARLAKEQDKNIFCIPGNINKATSYVPNKLIKDGAILVDSPEEIAEYFTFEEDKKVISKDFMEIYKYIGEEKIFADELCRLTGLSIATVNERLMLMEIEGLIKQVTGRIY